MPEGEVAEAEAEFDEGVGEGVGVDGSGEEVILGEAGGESREVEEFYHGEEDEEDAHEMVHPEVGGPLCEGDLEGEGDEDAEGEDDEKGGVGGEAGGFFFRGSLATGSWFAHVT